MCRWRGCLLSQQAFKAAITCACEMGTVVEGMVTVMLVTILDSFRLFVLIHVITVSQTSNQRCRERTSLVEHFHWVRLGFLTGDGWVFEVSRIFAGWMDFIQHAPWCVRVRVCVWSRVYLIARACLCTCACLCVCERARV